jgi:hypothetical protein
MWTPDPVDVPADPMPGYDLPTDEAQDQLGLL